MEVKYRYTKDTMLINPDNNWGDRIGYLILHYFSNSKKLKPEEVFNSLHYHSSSPSTLNGRILSIGSILAATKTNDIVWGSGCISPGSIGEKPSKIYAVRGPLTRDELIKKGIECPEVYGDPALLFPLIYNPPRQIKYEYGIIPHYIDYTDENSLKIISHLESQGVKVINITNNTFDYIDELLSVKKVLSSTLHGLITADAYGIPNIKITLKGLVGGQFKFKDYFDSVHRKHIFKSFIDLKPKIENLDLLEYNTKISFDLSRLLESGPWNDSNCKFF